jgi:hypothetical protein
MLAEEAQAHGWEAEAVRHERLAMRCEEFLAELGEQIADAQVEP